MAAAHKYLDRFFSVTRDDLSKNYFERDLAEAHLDVEALKVAFGVKR